MIKKSISVILCSLFSYACGFFLDGKNKQAEKRPKELGAPPVAATETGSITLEFSDGIDVSPFTIILKLSRFGNDLYLMSKSAAIGEKILKFDDLTIGVSDALIQLTEGSGKVLAQGSIEKIDVKSNSALEIGVQYDRLNNALRLQLKTKVNPPPSVLDAPVTPPSADGIRLCEQAEKELASSRQKVIDARKISCVVDEDCSVFDFGSDWYSCSGGYVAILKAESAKFKEEYLKVSWEHDQHCRYKKIPGMTCLSLDAPLSPIGARCSNTKKVCEVENQS